MATIDAHPRAGQIVAAARRYLGAPFRRQGRDGEGMDCAGLVVAAANGAGMAIAAPDWLPYRGAGSAEVETLFRACGCIPLDVAKARRGDVLLQWAAARQPHLALRTEKGVIEAHAGIGRVVERNLDAGERWDCAWRFPEKGW